MTGEQKPGGLEVALSAAMARAICEGEGKEWMALDNTRADVERWLRLGEITAEPAEARIRELEALLEQAGRYQAEFRDRATAALVIGPLKDIRAGGSWQGDTASDLLAALQQEGE